MPLSHPPDILYNTSCIHHDEHQLLLLPHCTQHQQQQRYPQALHVSSDASAAPAASAASPPLRLHWPGTFRDMQRPDCAATHGQMGRTARAGHVTRQRAARCQTVPRLGTGPQSAGHWQQRDRAERGSRRVRGSRGSGGSRGLLTVTEGAEPPPPPMPPRKPPYRPAVGSVQNRRSGGPGRPALSRVIAELQRVTAGYGGVIAAGTARVQRGYHGFMDLQRD